MDTKQKIMVSNSIEFPGFIIGWRTDNFNEKICYDNYIGSLLSNQSKEYKKMHKGEDTQHD